MLSDQFDWDVQRSFFEEYCDTYSESDRWFDYVQLLDQIRAGIYAHEI
jgi:hypothetical protein